MKVKLTVTAFLIILCIFVVGCSKSKTEPETTEPSTEETTTQKESNTGFSTFAAAVTGAT